MPTPRLRTLVSLAAALTVTCALGGCAGATARQAPGEVAPAGGSTRSVRFDNGAREYVHVYLVGDKREWLLGRVEPGARATLRIPEDALAGDARSMRLAVLTGARVTMRVASEPRAVMTMVQPASEMLSQQWTFSSSLAQGQLTALKLGAASAEVSRQ
ncbi:MAG: hypothetical protein ABIP93_10110 [Gemmatimonadaceae bacterium]